MMVSTMSVETLQDFVNTLDVETDGSDELSSPAALKSWVVGRDLLAPTRPVSGPDLDLAREVREALRLALRSHDGEILTEADARAVNQVLGRLPLALTVSVTGEPVLDGGDTSVAGAL